MLVEREGLEAAAAGRVDGRDAHVVRDREARAKRAFAPAQVGRVRGEDERRVARVGRLLDEGARQAPVLEDVELEPAWRSGRGGGHVGRGRGRDRRQAHDRAGRGRRTGRRGLAVRMGHALEGHGRDEHRQRHLRPEHRCLRAHARDVAKDPRPQLPAAVRFDVPAQRALVVGATREVAPGARPEPFLGQALVVPDVERGRQGCAGAAAGRRVRSASSRGASRSAATSKQT